MEKSSISPALRIGSAGSLLSGVAFGFLPEAGDTVLGGLAATSTGLSVLYVLRTRLIEQSALIAQLAVRFAWGFAIFFLLGMIGATIAMFVAEQW